MKVNIASLTGVLLDWAAAKAIGLEDADADAMAMMAKKNRRTVSFPVWTPSTDGCSGAELLERFNISVECRWPCHPDKREWLARSSLGHVQCGPTMLIAGMRCLVASQLGDVIEVPDSLLDQVS